MQKQNGTNLKRQSINQEEFSKGEEVFDEGSRIQLSRDVLLKYFVVYTFTRIPLASSLPSHGKRSFRFRANGWPMIAHIWMLDLLIRAETNQEAAYK